MLSYLIMTRALQSKLQLVGRLMHEVVLYESIYSTPESSRVYLSKQKF